MKKVKSEKTTVVRVIPVDLGYKYKNGKPKIKWMVVQEKIKIK